jgi:phosphate starvation-inducible protein PhoH and related proteins
VSRRNRAKRANRYNPRSERNEPNYINHKNDNVIELNFPKRDKKKRIEIIPRSLNQENYLAALEDSNKDIIFAIGPAGSGKTLIATLFAIRALKAGEIDKIVITRPNLAVDDRDIGFLPGDIFAKMAPWTKPISDIFLEYYSKKEYQYLLEEEIVELCPIAFIRGRTFKNSLVILDEAQGTSPNSLMSVLTRLGDGSKMIVTGDLDQADKLGSNGLSDFFGRWRNQSSLIEVIKFGNKDIERHRVIRDILKIYDKD